MKTKTKEEKKRRTFLWLETRAVHRLADDAKGEFEGVLDVLLGVVVLFKHTLGRLVVGADRGCLPSTIVSAGIRVIELEVKVSVPSCIEVRHSKRSQTCFTAFSSSVLLR